MTSDLTLANFAASVPAMSGGNTAYAARYARELREVAIRQAHRSPRSVQRSLGPSELGHRCHRLVIGKMSGQQVTNHVADPWPSIVGTAVHAQLAQYFDNENAMYARQRWITEARVAANVLIANPGTADLYDGHEYNLVDHKGISVSTPVAAPDGWTTMGQLSPGDTVFGADGRPCQVLRTYPVQYRDCYRITFDDGSDLITDDVQELPFVLSRPKPQPALMSTAEAAGKVWRPGAWPQRQLRLYNGGALELPPADLPVHPYVLGCWLGDGGVHGGTVSKPDDELYEHIRACGYEVSEPHGERQLVRTVYGLSGQLRVLGLQWVDPDHPESHGRLAGVKQVPPEYLRGSYEQRLSLLQGLMDTDGSWNRPRSRAVFTTTSKHLAEATAELIATLGWKACISPQQAHGFGLTVTAYHVEFTPSGANPFRLSRKASLVRLEGSRVSGYRIVRSIEPVLSVPTRCIDVDSPDHLYLAGEQMLPVHNCLGPTSMAKVMSAAGPPWHYVIQMLIYAQGYRDFGYRVDRVILAAWPRTAPTLDSMYCWERPYVPAVDDDLLRQVAAITASRREVASRVMAGRIPIDAVPRTPGDECFYCFAGDTEVVTRDGIKPIRELAGTEPELLVPDTGPEGALKSRGSFQKTEVRSFGQQRLWRIRLRNHGAVKDIYATAEHRWMLELRKSRANPDNKHGRVIRKLPAERFERVTSQLQPGDRLRPLRIHSAPDQGLAWVPDAIARGFVYGDGSVPAGSTGAEVSFFDRSNGKYEALIPFFRDHQDRVNVGQTATGDTRRRIRQLPANGKQLPDLSLPPDFLLSWLAGYFAADGNVSPEGQVTLSSAREDNIRYARDIAAICGVGYGSVRFTWRTGYGTEPSQLWSISLRRRDLPDWFLIRPQHLTNAIKASEARPREFYWSVESVTRTDQVEEVFCAVVPGVGAFGLADSIMTSNCPWFRPQSARDGGPGCPGHSAKT